MTTQTIDGLLTDWTDSQQILPGIYATSDANNFYFALKSTAPIGEKTTILLDTDQNVLTGIRPFGTANIGANYYIEVRPSGAVHLYDSLNTDLGLLSSQNVNGVLEVQVLKTAIGSPRQVNVFADVNDSVYLPGDYSSSPGVVLADQLVKPLDRKVGIVYSETSANKFFDKKAYGELFANAQSQVMQSGNTFDLLSETDLLDVVKISQYSQLVFPGLANVKATDLNQIAANLKLVQQNGAKFVAVGDFLTNDETGVAFTGNPYARMTDLLGVTRVSGGAITGNSSLVSGTDTLVSYTDKTSYNEYNSTNVLASQVTSAGTFKAVVSSDKATHFADGQFFADSGLVQKALATDNIVTAKMTRNNSIFVSRQDADISGNAQFGAKVETAVAEVLQDFKTKYNFVGSNYINTAANWAEMKPIYQRWLALGNEISTHSETHPTDVNNLTLAQLEKEFKTAADVLKANLGVSANGTATPGNPENLAVDKTLSGYFDYVSGVGGSSYTNSFGKISTTDKANFFKPNMSFDFTLAEFKKLTPAQIEAKWTEEYNQINKTTATPIYLFPWHDYAITAAGANTIDGSINPGYSKTLFENVISRAAKDGTEFVTASDLSARINAFDAAKLTTTQAGNTITAKLEGQNLGQFSLDVKGTIQDVTGYFAYDSNSVFSTETGGNWTINLGASQTDVTHIDKLDQRQILKSITGNGSNIDFSLQGSGTVGVDAKILVNGQKYKVTGADSFTQKADKLELKFNTDVLRTASVAIVENQGPIVQQAVSPTTYTEDRVSARTFNLSNIFKDVDGDNLTFSVKSISNTTTKATIANNILTVDFGLFEFGNSKIVVEASDGFAKVESTIDLTAKSVLPEFKANANNNTVLGTTRGEILKGLQGNDIIYGNGGNDILIGNVGNDQLLGAAGNDVLLGTDSVSRGLNEKDILTGGSGQDVFVLGDSRGAYYVGDKAAGFATIRDFVSGVDKIQLAGKASDYVISGKDILMQGDLIASTNVTGLNLASNNFQFV